MRCAQIPNFGFRIPDCGLRAQKSSEPDKLKKACREFESIFLAYLMKRMRATVPKTDLFGSQRDEEIFRDMMDDEIARSASEKQGLGLGDLIYKQLSRAVGNR